MPQRPTEEDMSCLIGYLEGCHMINDKETCLGSRDARGNDGRHGLKYHNEPCVWCSQGPCHSISPSRCEPFDFLMKGEAQIPNFTFYAKGAFEVPNCTTKGVSVTTQDFSCLNRQDAGCSALKDRG